MIYNLKNNMQLQRTFLSLNNAQVINFIVILDSSHIHIQSISKSSYLYFQKQRNGPLFSTSAVLSSWGRDHLSRWSKPPSFLAWLFQEKISLKYHMTSLMKWYKWTYYKTRDSQKTNSWFSRRRGSYGLWEGHVYTAVVKMDNQQKPFV